MSGDKPSTAENVDADLLDTELWGVVEEEERDPVAKVLEELGKGAAPPPVQVEQNLPCPNYFSLTIFLSLPLPRPGGAASPEPVGTHRFQQTVGH